MPAYYALGADLLPKESHEILSFLHKMNQAAWSRLNILRPEFSQYDQENPMVTVKGYSGAMYQVLYSCHLACMLAKEILPKTKLLEQNLRIDIEHGGFKDIQHSWLLVRELARPDGINAILDVLPVGSCYPYIRDDNKFRFHKRLDMTKDYMPGSWFVGPEVLDRSEKEAAVLLEDSEFMHRIGKGA